MNKIISSTFIIVFSLMANTLFAQQIDKEQRKIFQTDNVEAFKRVFSQTDFNKCLMVKENSFDLLSYSVKYERKNIFNFLLGKTSDINRLCGDQSPLMVAARYGKTDMAKTLLQKGANKTLKNSAGETAKDLAVKYEKPALVEILK